MESIRNLFKLEKENKPKIKKESKIEIIKNIRNIFKLKKRK